MSRPLLSPFRLGNIQLRNRVFLPGHTTDFGLNNLPTNRNTEYLAARARGGVGLIISEAIRIHPTSAGRNLTLGAFDDNCIDAYQKLTDGVHEFGSAIFAQIMHAGRQANGDATRTAAWSSSAIPWTVGANVPHVMSHGDIEAMVRAFGLAAVRMQRSGFDGLEVHIGHGHLIQQFLSPATNNRTDKYGGLLVNRIRFAEEVLSEIIKSVPDFVVGIRISADEFLPNGLDPSQMVEIVDLLLQKFDLGFVHVSHSAYHGSWTLPSQFADMNFGHAPYRHHAGIFKSAFSNLAVLAVCRLDTLTEAQELLENNEADLVGLARPHIADPDLVSKFKQNRELDVRSCIACNQECIGRVEKSLPISCVVNPEVGAERIWREIRMRPKASRKVLIIGGGPAGMKAAVAASEAGHQVTLLEASATLGGQVAVAAKLKKRERFGLLVQDLIRDLSKSNVKIKLNTKVSDLSEIYDQYDQIIVATGSDFAPRNFGVGIEVITPLQAIAKFANIKGNPNQSVVVLDEEGSWIAGSIAEELATNGFQVYLISPTASLFGQITMYSKLALIPRLKELGVRVYLSSKIEITNEILTISNSLNSEMTLVSNCIQVIDCGSRFSQDEIYQSVTANQNTKVHIIGDALSPRTATEAIYEGQAVGTFLDLDLALANIEQH